MDCVGLQFNVKMSLISLGIRPASKGFHLLCEAVCNYIARNDVSVKSVLDELCQKHHLTRRYLNRSIQLCLDGASSDEIKKSINNLAGNTFVTDNVHLSVSNFITIIGELILYRMYVGENDNNTFSEPMVSLDEFFGDY